MLGHPRGRLKVAGTYRVGQPVENFVIRVKIVEHKSLLAELLDDERRDYLIIEERDIAWQEKIFSTHETKYYIDEKNCTTDLHKEYRNIIVNSGNSENNEEQSRLYSYTSRDSYYPEKTILTSKNYATSLSKRHAPAIASPIVKNRKPFVERYNKKVVDPWPAKIIRDDNSSSYKDRTSMYILVDLSSRDGSGGLAVNSHVFPSSDSQILLCTLTYDRVAKTLTIDPDLSGNDDFYTVETMGLFYDYWIEDASIQSKNHDQQQQRVLRHVQEDRDEIHGDGKINEEIVMPPANILRLFVNMEIVSASKFPYDALFVTYELDLPRHWITSDIQRLTGTTQRCRMTDGKAQFGYISEIPLDFDLNCLNNENRVQPSWPRLIFTVGSIDHWTRYRIEGYASIPLPASPGTHRFDLVTSRPIGRFVNVLRRFFTGGETSDDVTYHPGESVDSARHEKTKGLVEFAPGGSIRINLNIVHQSKIFMKNSHLNVEAFERLGADKLINSLDNVLEQFKSARQRMIQARAQSTFA